MPIFILEGDDLSNSKLILAKESNLECESHLEKWLENSPWALVQDELILWIDRQPSARDEEGTIYPDLLGVNAEGNLIVVEFKRGRTPRDVVAQLLEYAALADELSEEEIKEKAAAYFETRNEFKGKQFDDVFKDVFDLSDTEELPPLNRNLHLYIVAEHISPRITNVCRFLRTSQGMDINCIDVSKFETETGETLISMEAKVGDENVVSSKTQKHSVSQISRWSGDKGARDVVRDAVREITQDNTDVEFTCPEVTSIIHKTYPNFNRNTVSGQIAQDCVNKPKRLSNYPHAKHDFYWMVSPKIYRLYDPERDKIEDSADSIQD